MGRARKLYLSGPAKMVRLANVVFQRSGQRSSTHRYTEPGRYVVEVRRETSIGNAVGHLYVVVGQ